MCSCDGTCPNRVLQNGVRVKLEVFKTENKVMLSIFIIFESFICGLTRVLIYRVGPLGQVKQFCEAHLYVSI